MLAVDCTTQYIKLVLLTFYTFHLILYTARELIPLFLDEIGILALMY